MSKFEIGAGYKTRHGREAGIYWIGPDAMHGWELDENGFRLSHFWYLDGKACSGDFDLMPKVAPLLECDFIIDNTGLCVIKWFGGKPELHATIRMREVRE